MLTQWLATSRPGPLPRAGDDDPDTAVLPDVDEKVAQLPPYKVILHNDDVNDFMHIIITILKLTPLKQERAVECTWEAHENGFSLLLMTHRERAELYVDQFKTCGVTVTCEPDA